MNLPKTYDPHMYEADMYALWERTESFRPKHRGSKESFSVVMPPPNANGNLHLGHALTIALEDIVIRWQRLKGKATLFVPGADHAGFETWVVYEKQLNKEGKTRFDFSREELYSRVWDFVQLNKTNFDAQLRSLGASCDWSAYTFTLDDKVVNTAYAVFKKLWDDKLIYRGVRLVNYCTFHGTSFSDIEVAYKQELGKLWHIRYPLTDGSDSIVVATTRPETMLGDVAVAVHPSDERYQHLIGKSIRLPLTNRDIPIIGDEFVDIAFGSGAVKITPAHDNNDFECAQRHDLPHISVIDHEGKITHQMPENYRGMDALEARMAIVAELERLKLLVDTVDHEHSVGHCYKCDTIIQQLLRDQWFIDMKPLAAPAIEALKANKITFFPAAKQKEVTTYLEGIRDWNISRQIAWGIPIPAFQNVDDSDDWIYDERVTEELITIDNKTYRRDPDVFDTWFSSGQWPYATLGYPDTDEYKQFYPNNLMETGKDLLQQWVSRMVVLGVYVTGGIPFKQVYMHGMVLDEHGQKMSKSKGNVINPMDMVQKYGSDALRMGIISGQSAGNNQPFNESKIVAARNFTNKLWNIARYVMADTENLPNPKDATVDTPADHWIVDRLALASKTIDEHLTQYRFAEAYEALYHFVWDDFADWYVEATKAQANKSLLPYCLEAILKLAHPFAPFATETIWQAVAWEPDTILAISSWPKTRRHSIEKASEFEQIKDIVSEIRYMQAAMQISKPNLYFKNADFLAENADVIVKLAKLQSASQVSDGRGFNLTHTTHECWLDIDADTARQFTQKLNDSFTTQQQVVDNLTKRLANKAYVDNAPEQIVDQTKQQLTEEQALLERLRQEVENYSGNAPTEDTDKALS